MSAPSLPVTDLREPGPRGSTPRGEAGVAATEAILVMIPLSVFLLLSPLLYQWWALDQRVRIDAHRRTFFGAVSFVDVKKDGDPPQFLAESWKSGSIPSRVSPNDLVNTAVLGSARGSVKSTGIFAGVLKLERSGFVVRPPWTWSGYPYNSTQTSDQIWFNTKPTINETEPVRTWYSDALGISDTVKEGLKLGD